MIKACHIAFASLSLLSAAVLGPAAQAQDYDWGIEQPRISSWNDAGYDASEETSFTQAQKAFTLKIQSLPAPAAAPKERRMTADEKYALEEHLFDNIPEGRNWLGLPQASGPFMQWSWQVSAYAQYSTEVFQRGSGEHLFGGGFSIGFYVYDNVAFNMEFEGAYADLDEGDNGFTYLMTLNTRWHLLNFSQWELEKDWAWLNPITIYMELGVGMSQSEHRLPTYEGTHFNFTAQGGFGMTYEIQPGIHIFGALRYYHLSNARSSGADRNPSWDGLKVYAGVMWTF